MNYWGGGWGGGGGGGLGGGGGGGGGGGAGVFQAAVRPGIAMSLDKTLCQESLPQFLSLISMV